MCFSLNHVTVLQYELYVRTGNKGAASLSDVIYATVYGARGDTGCRLLRKSNNQDMFNQGQVGETTFLSNCYVPKDSQPKDFQSCYCAVSMFN